MTDTFDFIQWDWLADLERVDRIQALTEALHSSWGGADLDRLDVEAVARAYVHEPMIGALSIEEFTQLVDFIEAGWEFSVDSLILALGRGISLRDYVTRLVAQRLHAVVTHFGLSAEEVTRCMVTNRDHVTGPDWPTAG